MFYGIILVIEALGYCSVIGEIVTDLVVVENVYYHGNRRFPDVIDVHLNHNDNNIYLRLNKDSETTDILSEDLFQTSNILPSGLFKEDKRNNFAAYDSGNSDILIVHRESSDALPKFYGRFTSNKEKLVIFSQDGSHDNHHVRRDLSQTDAINKNRNDTADDILELFIFADLSVYQHVRDELMPDKTADDIKKFLRTYLKAMAKEVDTIYQYLGVFGTNRTMRIYLQQYQTITHSNQQKWVENNFSNNRLQSAAVSDLQSYYGKLVTRFEFPITDHLVAITKLNIEGDLQVISTGKICGSRTDLATSIVRIENFPVTMAQGIALTLSVPFDGEGNDCSSIDQFIMSPAYGLVSHSSKQGNRWKFSECSINNFKNAFDGGMDLSCLKIQDATFDFQAFDESSYISEFLTLNEQCVLRYQAGSTFCDGSQGNKVDCYSSTQGCTDSGTCSPFTVPQFTPCDSSRSQDNPICRFGVCSAVVSFAASGLNISSTSTSSTSSTTSSTTTDFEIAMLFFSSSNASSTSTSTTTSPTTACTTSSPKSELQTTTQPASSTKKPNPDCVIKTGFVEFDLPGCGCCGGCGCDDKCTSCSSPGGLPAFNETESCTEESECCKDTVTIETMFVPEGCDAEFIAGPQTIIVEKRGWEDEDLDVTAEVYQDIADQWQVNLVPKDIGRN